ncbi:hypothetical protein CHU98_g7510 [Xylaria longipes]|nr:hypothetical protein CHU98_g7510 [Xylaria longipes]
MGQEIDDERNMKYHLQVVRQKLKAADAAYEAKQAKIRELRASWQDGFLEMTRGQFQEETKRLEEEISRKAVIKAYSAENMVVLDEAERAKLSDPNNTMPISQALYGRTLKFLNDYRPAIKYFYFCFAMNLLRRQKFKVDSPRAGLDPAVRRDDQVLLGTSPTTL